MLTDAGDILSKMAAKISRIFIWFCSWIAQCIIRRCVSAIFMNKEQIESLIHMSKKKKPLIILPNHLSHLDYVLVTYVFWRCGVRLPYVAAGNNLDTGLMSPILRRLGAFFIRRRSSGVTLMDTLYRITLSCYVAELVKHNECIEIFLEAGRSRTGRRLPAKSGLLSVIVNACLEGAIDDAWIVPVSITYEKLAEGGFASELLVSFKTFMVAMCLIFKKFYFISGPEKATRNFSICNKECSCPNVFGQWQCSSSPWRTIVFESMFSVNV
ncbi:unnamed protein product [Soboliphyme baturini]|uniref:PlsC domain-containing protein n=1 Tax=Soboliphyme baturini TaxID=241478 RepID=A0A183J8S8_9BILA|nr:unnamed protein product [Soboliphyme baturini]